MQGWGQPRDAPWHGSVADLTEAAERVACQDGSQGPLTILLYMDDLVLVEPGLGLRLWRSRQVAEEGIKKLLGNAAVNAAKREEEGALVERLIVWGIEFRTDVMEAAMPEPKLTHCS